MTTLLSNRSGRYSGLQARIRQRNEFAIYVSCAGHNPNLVGVKAEGCCIEIVKFLDFVQRLYAFFSASTHRCSVLKSVLGNYHVMVKRLADMRWSAHFDAVYVLREGFADIFSMHWILHQLILTSDQEIIIIIIVLFQISMIC